MIKKIKIKELIHVLMLLLVTFILGIYLVSEKLVKYSSANTEITTFHIIIQILALLSIFVLSLYIAYDISKRFFTRLGISVGLYWLVSYFVFMTQNLNKKAFHADNLLKNHFFEINSSLFLLILGIFVLGIHLFLVKLPVMKKVDRLFSDYKESNLSLSLLMSLIVLQDSKLIETIKQFLSLGKNGNLTEYLTGLYTRLPLIIIPVAMIVYAFWIAVEGIRENKSTVSLAFVSSLLFALVFNYTIQDGLKINDSFYGKYIFPGATLFQIIVITLFAFIVYLLINRYWLATLLILFTGTALTIANSLKFAMRNEPLLLTDLSMASQLDLIFNFLGSEVNFRVLFFTITLVLWLVLFSIFLSTRYLTKKIIHTWKKQVVAIFLIAVSFMSIFSVFSHQENGNIKSDIPVLSRLNNGLNILFTGYASTARFQSLMFLWIKQATTPIMEKPVDYSQQTMAALVKKYEDRAKEINKTRDKKLSEQTVIFILSESLSDPTRVPDVTLTENVLSNIEQIKSETTSGVMKSDAYGGGTANIETQTLLGLPLYNLASSIGIYNVQVVPKMSILPSISDAYPSADRTFIHLGSLKLYSRLDVYGRLGFKKLIADDKNATKPSVNEKYGIFPSDDSTYQNILDNLNTKKSQFFSVVTYQNHVPWDMPEPAELGGQGEGFTASENGTLSHYVRLLKHTDMATKEFLDKLSSIDKDITVVFYGDHLPGLYPKTAFKKNPESQYLTDYFIWSNHNNQKKEYPEVNSSDFPAAVLAHTNSKVSPYYALLTDVLDDASVDKKKLTKAQQKIANDLKLVQYDLVSGNGYLKNYPDFFKIE